VHETQDQSVIGTLLLQRVVDRLLQRHRMTFLPSQVEGDVGADGGTR
jgi:hypothetical protein